MKKRIVLTDIVCFSAILCFLVFMMVISSPVTIWEGCKFYFYVIFSVLIPGIAVYRLLQIPCADSMEEVVCGYGLGYGFVILQYFIFALFQKLSFLSLGQILISCSSFLYFLWSTITRKQAVVRKSDIKRDWYPLVILVLLAFGIRYVSYYGMNLLPSLGRDVIFETQDILFYIGNAISAKKGFPLEEFRFLGQTFKYHYFGSIFLGATSLFTGIDTLKLEVCLQWMQPIILIPLSFYVLMRRMKIQRRFCFWGMILLLFTAGAESLVYVAYQSILYESPFGFDLGLIMGILFVLYLSIQNSLEKFHGGIFSATLFSFFLCEGTKAPIAVVMLFLAGNICLLWLFSRGKRKWAVLYGIFLMIVFLAVFFIFVSDGMSTVTTNASGLRFDLTSHLFESGLGKLYFKWTAQGLSGWMGKLIILLLYFFCCNMAVYGIFPIFIYKAMLSGKRTFFSFEGCMLSAVIFGLVFTLFTKQAGNSQMYFAMTSFPIAVIWMMKSWEQSRIAAGGYRKNKSVRGCFITCSVFCFWQA